VTGATDTHKPMLFAYPERCAFGRAIPKTRIEQHGRPGAKARAALTAQVARLVWQHKLAPDTLGLPAASAVAEIQILRIELKPGVAELGEDVLRCLDKAIAFPVIHEVHGDEGLYTVAAPKRPSEADGQRWVIGDYFAGGLADPAAARQPLPVALDLASLYMQLLRTLMPWPAKQNESLQAQAERLAKIRTLEKEQARIAARMQRQTQFNRRVELNHQHKALQADIDRLTR